MRTCPSCGAEIVGTWRSCPLCRVPLRITVAEPVPDPYPAAPLRFDRRQIQATLISLSVLGVLASFGIQTLLPDGLRPAGTVWLSIATLWLVVLAVLYRRHHVGWLVIQLVVLLSLVAAGWDAAIGWSAWSVTWAIPAICAVATVGLGVAVRLIRLEPVEYVFHLLLVVLFGLVPGVFVLLGWVTVALPSLLCTGFSLTLLVLAVILRRADLTEALHRIFRF
jgi:Family of unknown function (DUF6320)